MPNAIHVATGTSDVQVISGAVNVLGYSVRESGIVGAAATVILRNGTSTSAPAVAIIELAADRSETNILPSVSCPNGLFVDRVTGETELVIYVS